jgi:asparagine synthase (glutamine-hydrolysing)
VIAGHDDAPAVYPVRLRPTPLELASGLTFGADDQAPRVQMRGAPHPRAAIEELLRAALARPPCLVSFSGGRDSSSVLATATAVARRDGLPLPIPTTLRFPGAPGADESEWQELVVRHLRLPDWDRIEISTELDLIGPYSGAVLRRHGVLWPPFSYVHEPILERAKGGTVLTGAGGDEALSRGAFSGCRGRGWLRRSNLTTLAVALAPRAVRRRRFAREPQPPSPWLHRHVEAEVHRLGSEWRGRSPDRWDAAIAWWWRSRYRANVSASLDLLAADAGTTVVSVFVEPTVVGALCRHFGFRGPASRKAAVSELFGDVLPPALVQRTGKAFFDEAVLGERTMAFAAAWDGTGVDAALVDLDRLAEEWRRPKPDVRTALLLQHAWLSAI